MQYKTDLFLYARPGLVSVNSPSNPVQSRFTYEACLKTTTAGQRAEQSEIAKKNNTIKHKDHKNIKGNPHTESKAKEYKFVLRHDCFKLQPKASGQQT